MKICKIQITKIMIPIYLFIAILLNVVVIDLTVSVTAQAQEYSYAAEEGEEYMPRDINQHDSLEPIYPHLTALTLTTDQIYERTLHKSNSEMRPSAEVERVRKEVIELYKSVGIDVSLDNGNWLESERLIDDKPQRYSRETPKPLDGLYEQYFSVDSPWNNKIPEDSPQLLLDPTVITPIRENGEPVISIQLHTVKTKEEPNGTNVGVPIVVADENDLIYTLVEAYSTEPIARAYNLRAPANIKDLLNQGYNGDQHGLLVDSVTNTAVSGWLFRPKDDPRGYEDKGGLKYGYDMRVSAATIRYKLDSMGEEGRVSTNAAGIPMDAVSIKSWDISGDSPITHAIGGAGFPLMKARVYPAISYDNFMTQENDTAYNANKGVIPYGAVIRIDKSYDLDGLYESGKLSLPGYKILKAWQDYGYYNVDASGVSDRSTNIMPYTSTVNSDWVNSGDERYNVPSQSGVQGYDKVQAEINAVINGNSGFEKPDIYLTVPVAKYADLDVNGDGKINALDKADIEAKVNTTVSQDNSMYDANQDGVIDENDVQVLVNYFNNQPQHDIDYKEVTVQETSNGYIVVSSSRSYTHGAHQVPNGQWTSIAAIPDPGYKFKNWTGALANVDNQIVEFIIGNDMEIGAVFEPDEMVELTVYNAGEGEVFYMSGDNKSQLPKTYGKGEVAVLRAIPKEGYVFSGWTGDVISSSENIRLFMDSDKTIIANYVQTDDVYEIVFDNTTPPSSWQVITNTETGSVTLSYSTDSKTVTYPWLFGKYEMILNDKTFGESYKINLDYKTPHSGENPGNIFFHYQDYDNYYRLQINADGKTSLYCKVDGLETLIPNSSVNLGSLSNSVSLQIERHNTGDISVSAYKGGSRLNSFKVKDESFNGIDNVKIGIGFNANAAASFGNIKVIRLDDAEPGVETPCTNWDYKEDFTNGKQISGWIGTNIENTVFSSYGDKGNMINFNMINPNPSLFTKEAFTGDYTFSVDYIKGDPKHQGARFYFDYKDSMNTYFVRIMDSNSKVELIKLNNSWTAEILGTYMPDTPFASGIPITVSIKNSMNSDGGIAVSIDGTEVINSTGNTIIRDGGKIGIGNQYSQWVKYGNIVVKSLSGDIMFAEQFENGGEIPLGWECENEDVYPEEYANKGNWLVSSSEKEQVLINRKDFFNDNYLLSIDFETPNEGTSEIYFNYHDSENYYKLSITNSNTVTLNKSVNKIDTYLGSSEFTPEVINNVQIKWLSDGTSIITINGESVLCLNDNSLNSGGSIGIGFRNAEGAKFGNLTVRGVSEEEAEDGLPANAVEQTNTAERLYVISFDLNEGARFNNKVSVPSENKVSMPASPSRGGYIFDGWYTDNNTFLNAWDYDIDTVNESITLYAKWISDMVTVSFNTGGDLSIQPIIIPRGSIIDKPADPVQEGFTFLGWAKDMNTTANLWDFISNTVSDDITLYAMFLKIED